MRISPWFIQLFIMLLSTGIAVAADETIPKKTGDQVDIPLGQDKQISSNDALVWKHNIDLAIDLEGGEMTSYRQFKERGSLDTKTGALTIRELTPSDSGEYTALLNNKIIKKVQLNVINPVTKPSVSTHCNEEKTSCVFTCECNTTGADTVEYSWILGDKEGVSSSKDFSITQEIQETYLICTVKNPVSEEHSERIPNPLISSDQSLWLLLLLLLLLPVAVGVGFVIWKLRSGRYELALDGQLCSFWRRRTDQNSENVQNHVDVPRNHEQQELLPKEQRRNNADVSEAAPTGDKFSIRETSHQNGTCVASPETSNEDEESTLVSVEVHQTHNQDETSDVTGDQQATDRDLAAATCVDPESSSSNQQTPDQRTPMQHAAPETQDDDQMSDVGKSREIQGH